jgi:hypothetical protein
VAGPRHRSRAAGVFPTTSAADQRDARDRIVGRIGWIRAQVCTCSVGGLALSTAGP